MLKSTSFSCKCLNLIICILSIGFQLQAEKRALLITVGEHADGRWKGLHAKQDGEIIKKALINGQHFPAGNITVVDGKRATKTNVVVEIDNFINKIKPGDVAIVFFSGHGQHVTDVSGDEIDGWDEALVLYDTEFANDKNRKSAETHLIDDELTGFRQKLRKKAGAKGDVLFFVDACYSGTILRSDDSDSDADSTTIYRGGDKYVISPQFITKNKNMYQVYSEYESAENASGLAPYVVITACASHQRTVEYNGTGALSFIVSQILYENLSKMDYASFFDILRSRKNKLGKQYILSETPQIEGNINRLMFAGGAINIPKHFTINRTLENNKSKSIIVNAGEWMGITKGTELSFYPPMTLDIKKVQPLFSGKVESSNLVECVVKISSSSAINNDSWVFVSKYTFPSENKEEYIANRLREARTPDDKSILLEIIPLNSSGNKGKQFYNNMEFVYSNSFEVKVTNNGNNPLYFQLINILPNNKIKKFNFGLHNNDNYIGPKESKSGKRFVVSNNSPQGLETLMVIATDKPIDLSSIGNISRDDEYLEDLFTILSGEDRAEYYTLKTISIDKKNYIIKSK